ncbi:MAG: restriction endonuclease [Candidatus Pacebacteria bacterium]|nr:restriction endonuclease [Candidatus Paceibacterota bacterium]MBP9772306.1 restriction endonuclease [Candidatus Paceibacterota bacterium]QQR76849.1 MAG: restriction endonuclease [Candidatus Nomurabacteria bacterium]
MQVIKSTGEKELFDKEKLCSSLEHSGAPKELAKTVCESISSEIDPDITTSNIYRKALSYLIKEDLTLAAVYSLRKAVSALGPAGFIFERYIATILESYGYKTKLNQIMKGACIEHEVDVAAEKEDTHFLVEAKYHNEQGIRTHVPVVMYAYARLLDIEEAENKKERNKFDHKMWVITNTKFTDTAVRYAKCRSIKITGWNYPEGDSLEDMIVKNKLFPVTVLPSVDKDVLDIFSKNNIMLAQDIILFNPKTIHEKFGIEKQLAEQIYKEAITMTK